MNDKKAIILDFIVDKIYCIGDIHGNFGCIRGFIKQNNIHNSLLIICGDCGFGFESDAHYKQTVFPKLSKTLSKYNDYCVFIRGNHDDASLFNSFIFNYKRIKVVPDYTILNTYYDDTKAVIKHSILCIGGATSIDRTLRNIANERNLMEYKLRHHNCSTEEASLKSRKCYWENEQPQYSEELLNTIDIIKTPIDVICTHTAPSFCNPLSKISIQNWFRHDPTLENDINNERRTMDEIYNYVIEHEFPVAKWCYGHFHFTFSEYIDGIKYRLLDMERQGKIDYEVID